MNSVRIFLFVLVCAALLSASLVLAGCTNIGEQFSLRNYRRGIDADGSSLNQANPKSKMYNPDLKWED